MQIFSTIAVIFVLAFSLLQCGKTGADTAKNNSNPPAAGVMDEAPRISLADAKKAFDEGNVIFIDTRADAAYRDEHIKDAINIMADALQTRSGEVPKDKQIIAYCS